jgi:mRNA-degrading endonuclease RelE of RelBE toxin-antitoxin system
MRKNIDIPDEIVKDLKKLAVDADKDLKNYIQELLVEHVKKAKKK